MSPNLPRPRAPSEATIDSFGSLDVLVNNAGFGNVNSIEDIDLNAFRQEIETNLFGTIIMSKAAIPLIGSSALVRL